MSERFSRFCSWWTLGLGVTVWHYCVRVHGNIASSRVWVHGTVIHHSWLVWVEFVFRTTSNEDS